MFRPRTLLPALLLFAGIARAAAQGGADYYRSPVAHPITLSGNPSEIRADHFHAGYDIRPVSIGATGDPIYAVADGYLSRIVVSPTGYGKALYITHPNGEVSVYGHLLGFSSNIGAWVRKQQYNRKSFAVDLYPDKALFPVKKGERIASMGNSGSSGGAHLHFEIRDARAGQPRNLTAEGVYTIPDHIAPSVLNVLLFEVDTLQWVPVHRLVRSVPASSLARDSVLYLSKNGYLAYEVIDYKDATKNTLGVYSLTQKIDGQVGFSFAIDRVDFATTRYVNTFVSYAQNRTSRNHVLRAYVSPNNPLQVYRNVVRRGVIDPPEPGCSRRIETTVSDDAGNRTTLRFWIGRGMDSACPEPVGEPVFWNREFRKTVGGWSLTIPSGALYESTLLPVAANADSTVFSVGSGDVPLQLPVRIVKKDPAIPVALQSKALIVRQAAGKSSAVGGNWDNLQQSLSASTRTLGDFAIGFDTLAPVITPLAKPGTTLRGELGFTVTDDLSGIASYTLTVDGAWALLEYDPKSNRMSHAPVAAGGPASRRVVLTVTDAKANKQTFQGTYVW